MRQPVEVAWLSGRVLLAIRAEADRTYPNETGGVLLGYWATSYTEVVIMDMVGPGLKACHQRSCFVPDAEFQEAELAQRYLRAPERSAYLGDWHTHPEGQPKLSCRDLHTARQIATYKDARAPVPLMGVMAFNTVWDLSVWRYTSPHIGSSNSRDQISLMNVVVFDED